MTPQGIGTPVSAVVTAYQRTEKTLATLRRLRACEPPPDEILVHVDSNQEYCADAVRLAFPDITVLLSVDSVGPGGGRNKLVAAAKNEFVASFDDDSYPVDADYFERIRALFNLFPEADVVCGQVNCRGEPAQADLKSAEWVADFLGGACVFRRERFISTGGYVPLTVAYGMEEVDFALRLHARGGRVLRSGWLRVFHDTDLAHRAAPAVAAASVANVLLLAYLRYPRTMWWVGAGQCLNLVAWLLRNGRRRGVARGLLMAPRYIWRNRHHRARLTATTVKTYLALRRAPAPIDFPTSSHFGGSFATLVPPAGSR